MYKIFSIILIFVFINTGLIYCQDISDTLKTKVTPSQKGISLLIGLLVGAKGEPNRLVGNIGLNYATVTTRSETSSFDRYLSIEFNKINNKLFYTFLVGVNMRGAIEMGASVNCWTNFNGKSAILLHPHMGMAFLQFYGLIYGEVSYDVPLLNPNFEVKDRWLIGIRYYIGFWKIDK